MSETTGSTYTETDVATTVVAKEFLSDATYILKAKVIASDTNNDNKSWFFLKGGVKIVSGVLTIIGTSIIENGYDNVSGWTADFGVDGSNLLVNVVGDNIHTIYWVARLSWDSIDV